MKSGIQTSPKPLPIAGQYNIQRFRQFSPEDCAGWYLVPGRDAKSPYAMYPTMGRKHISYQGINRLVFSTTPRAIFRSINYWYAVVGNAIYRIDAFYNKVNISQGTLLTTGGNVFFDYLVAGTITFACFTDGQKIYVYQENTNSFQIVTDPKAPINPTYIAAFGNRITVSQGSSSTFYLSVINLLNNTGNFDPATCFTINSAAVFAQESGIIRQMGVLNNTLYIFTDFTIGIWANIPALFSGTGTVFPWKKNTTYDWNFGIADPLSLDIDFGYMTFLAQNRNGLLQVMTTQGNQPEKISSKAIDVLFQRYANSGNGINPFLEGNASGFLYQYENTIFYRLSAGQYNGTGLLDFDVSTFSTQESANNCIEYNFETQTWHRCIELNGERNRVQDHVFFNGQHLVTIQGDSTIYEMTGGVYTNEIRNPLQSDIQQPDAYLAYPFRYERITPIISEQDYSEFETEFVQIDFVFGESNISYSLAPFSNTQFIIGEQTDGDGNPIYVIDEQPDSDGQPVFMIVDGSNTPSLNDPTYNQLFKPSIQLYWSDDGGISFSAHNIVEFSQMGQYQWRMRWYQLGASRNRVYKLIAVSPVPIVILGGIMMTKRISGGAC